MDGLPIGFITLQIQDIFISCWRLQQTIFTLTSELLHTLASTGISNLPTITPTLLYHPLTRLFSRNSSFRLSPTHARDIGAVRDIRI